MHPRAGLPLEFRLEVEYCGYAKPFSPRTVVEPRQPHHRVGGRCDRRLQLCRRTRIPTLETVPVS